MRKSELFVLFITFISFLVGIFFYDKFPENIASHWDFKGQVDGYIPKFWGLFLMPIISTVMLVLFILIPRIDPLKHNIKKFIKNFDIYIIIISLFLFYIYTLTIFWNLGMKFNMTYVIIPPLMILFFYAGILMEKSKRNWFIGLRTPWTMSNDKVWEKTNKIAGKIFKISGIIIGIGLILPDYILCILILIVIFISFYPIIYSFIEYRKINKKRK